MNRIHVITLGVKDIDRSLAFYRDGISFKTTVSEENPPIVFFQNKGVALALCPREGLTEDINKDHPPAGSGFSGTTLGYVVEEEDEVEKILSLAEEAGGKIIKKAQWAFCGGYHGYFSDPDCYYWEVMYWENWKFKNDGSLDIE